MNGIPSLLPIPKKDCHKTYHGPPTFIGWNKTRALKKLNEKISNLTHVWQEKLLYGAGNEILIKTITQSILYMQ